MDCANYGVPDRVKGAAERLANEVASRRTDTGARAHTLAGGIPGVGLFLAYAAKFYPHAGYSHATHHAVERLIALLPSRRMHAGLMEGLSGLGWLLSHLGGLDPDFDVAELTDIDSLLLGAVQAHGKTFGYDLVQGLVGIGVYGLERIARGEPSASAGRAIVDSVVHELLMSRKESRDGVYWVSTHTAPPPVREYFSGRKFVSLGMAHGLAGVIGFLAAVTRLYGRPPNATVGHLLESAVGWLVRRRISTPESRYPGWCPVDGAGPPTRTAWCYGDAGVALALAHAWNALGGLALRNEARATAMAAAQRSVDATLVGDAGLCHGAAGLAVSFGHLQVALGVPALADAAMAWTRRTVESFPFKMASALSSDYVAQPGFAPYGFLYGEAGVALALLSLRAPDLTGWQRSLLVRTTDSPTASPSRFAGMDDDGEWAR